MKCNICGRDKLDARELSVHRKYYHKPSGQQVQIVASGACPDCGSTLYFEEGCVTCHSCGYSKCG